MNKAQFKQITKKIDEIIRHKKMPIFPILGGLSTTQASTRAVTPEEANILSSKGLPTPITIDLHREGEFLEYLKYEHRR